jgi:di/tripeptidase
MDTKYMAYTIDMGNTTGEIPRQAGKQKKDFQVTHLSDRHSVKRASHMMV